jgi:hypothetical protein
MKIRFDVDARAANVCFGEASPSASGRLPSPARGLKRRHLLIRPRHRLVGPPHMRMTASPIILHIGPCLNFD